MVDRCHSIFQAQREREGESQVTPREGHWRGGSTKLFSANKKKSWWDEAEWIWFSESAQKTTPETRVYFPDTIWPLKMVVSVISVDFMRSLWGEQNYEPVYTLNHDLSNSIEIWIVYKFTCRCKADYVEERAKMFHRWMRHPLRVTPSADQSVR